MGLYVIEFVIFGSVAELWLGTVFPVLAAPPARVAADVAAPGAEADPDPGAAIVPAVPDHAPIPGQSPGPSPGLSPDPRREPPGGASRSRVPGLGPVPGPSLGAAPHSPAEEGPNQGLGPNLRVDLSPLKTME